MSLRKEIEDISLSIEKRIIDRENEIKHWGDKQRRNAYLQHTKFQQAQKDNLALLDFIKLLKEENQELSRVEVSTPRGEILQTATHQYKTEQR